VERKPKLAWEAVEVLPAAGPDVIVTVMLQAARSTCAAWALRHSDRRREAARPR
jgi:hypothetical protein